MNINDREHYELMMQFEKSFPGNCYDREPKKLWAKGIIYENGIINEFFIKYRMGYAHRTCIANLEECEEIIETNDARVKKILKKHFDSDFFDDVVKEIDAVYQY